MTMLALEVFKALEHFESQHCVPEALSQDFKSLKNILQEGQNTLPSLIRWNCLRETHEKENRKTADFVTSFARHERVQSRDRFQHSFQDKLQSDHGDDAQRERGYSSNASKELKPQSQSQTSLRIKLKSKYSTITSILKDNIEDLLSLFEGNNKVLALN